MFIPQSHLNERCRWIEPGIDLSTLKEDGFILYWMRFALRADENPALDVAINIASQQNCRLLVYQELNCRDEFSSDRHYTFALEGAADVKAQLADIGISYVFHLNSSKKETSPLAMLARQAQLIITDEMPTSFATKELDSLKALVETPFVCVDTSCVLPMQLSTSAFTRAFEYRNATKDEYEKRILSPWPQNRLSPKPFPIDELPFPTIDFNSANITELISNCEIDHSIPPVADTRGGTTAGYQRWSSFKENGLSQYANHRNDPLLHGVSRMSA